MPQAPRKDQYAILPPRGLRARGPAATTEVQSFFRSTAAPTEAVQNVTVAEGRQLPLRVVDSIGDDGAKLVEASPEDLLALRALQPGLRIVPVVYYTPAVAPRAEVITRPEVAAAAPGAKITLRVISRQGKQPVAGAIVVAFTDFATGAGAQGTTNSRGEVGLDLGGSEVALDRLYVYPTNAFWTLRKANVKVTDGMQFALRPLDLGYVDCLRHYYPDAPDDAGAGVTVAVVDTGVSDHPDLVVAGGLNTVPGEDPDAFGDNGRQHGTHVAGIVAARGVPPTGVRGVAPGVTLRSYRVFAKGSGSASSFAVAKAIDAAVADGCDLVNMSLGGGAFDPVLAAAVEDARAGGSLCVIAAGNDDRGPVSFPASNEMAVAVSAMGRKGTFPSGTAEVDDVAAPYGTDKADFIGAFSNIGPPVDLTAPGVAIISTVPGSYTEISGTSMACPVVTGVAARLVASAGLPEERGAARSEALLRALLASATSRGFKPIYEGHGLPLPVAPAG